MTPTYRHVVDWTRVADALELACEMRDVSLRDVADELGIAASGLTRLRQGKHLSADGLAALVSWMFPARIPTWIKPSGPGEVPRPSACDRVLELTGGKSGEENPGYRLRINSKHLARLADESPSKLLPGADRQSIRIYGYPIRLDDSVTEMHLEPSGDPSAVWKADVDAILNRGDPTWHTATTCPDGPWCDLHGTDSGVAP